MFELGESYLVYPPALRWCTEPLSNDSSHFSYLPPQGLLYPAEFTMGIFDQAVV